ncbi:hypothetical protein EYF80_010620 [Liparis tanakae]|uniref:Uncharacterized protein n=1 Tax=Liparis tanakae TaxID=230148 RepID=A0A4Z2IPN5_9TELE|nr:hypothetical protein EYF80_010620 [Liparis tanakae]
MTDRLLILPHVVGAQFTSFLIPATLAGRAEDHKAASEISSEAVAIIAFGFRLTTTCLASLQIAAECN